MLRQQAYLKAHFEKLGGRVSLQEFDARHPQTGNPVRLANLIVEWHPDRKERILLVPTTTPGRSPIKTPSIAAAFSSAQTTARAARLCFASWLT